MTFADAERTRAHLRRLLSFTVGVLGATSVALPACAFDDWRFVFGWGMEMTAAPCEAAQYGSSADGLAAAGAECMSQKGFYAPDYQFVQDGPCFPGDPPHFDSHLQWFCVIRGIPRAPTSKPIGVTFQFDKCADDEHLGPREPLAGNLRYCKPVLPKMRFRPKQCTRSHPQGNPIYPGTGMKSQLEPLGVEIGGYQLTMTYDTRDRLPEIGGRPVWSYSAAPSFGPQWQSNLHRRLAWGDEIARPSVTNKPAAVIHRGGGEWEAFEQGRPGAGGGTVYRSATDPSNQIAFLRGYEGRDRWVFTSQSSLVEEVYDTDGFLLSIHGAQGRRLTFEYSTTTTNPVEAPRPGLLLAIRDEYGREVRFAYELGATLSSAPRIKSMRGPRGEFTFFGYDQNGYLQRVTWPDQMVRKFVYERADLPWALTGVVDERSVRLSTFTYDGVGRAISTERAGGTQKYTFVYGGPAPSWSINEAFDAMAGAYIRSYEWLIPSFVDVTGPLNVTNRIALANIAGTPSVSALAQPAGAGCGASTSAQEYDSDGNVSYSRDFRGFSTCSSFDAVGRERVRVEGIGGAASGAACGALLLPGVGLPGSARKLTTEWHQDGWHLRTKVAEPERITYYIYHGQPDPFAGSALALCANGDPRLPDGKSLALLCRQVEQATTDATGSSGFGAPLQPDVPLKVTSWFYDGVGRVQARTDPNGAFTSLSYHSSTNFSGTDPYAQGHTAGDLAATSLFLSDKESLTTTYTTYDKRGKVLQSMDPNGVVTTSVYDLRGRVTAVNKAGSTTTYDYWPTGLLKTAAKPDGSWTFHEYDDAQRLRRVTDDLGNSITFTLDNLGNRTAEEVRDPANVLRRRLTRTIDALGRVEQVAGRE